MRPALLIAAVALFASAAKAQIAPERIQLRSNWCWAAVSQSILAAHGVTRTQEEIADWATPGSFNIPNYMTGERFNPHRRGVDLILQHFGQLSSSYFSRNLSFSECTQQVDATRPFAIGYQWAGGGAHAAVGTHCDPLANSITVMDPVDGFVILNFATFVHSSSGSWTETLTVAPPPPAPVAPAAPQLQYVVTGVCAVQLVWSRPAVGPNLVYQIERSVSGGPWAVVHQDTGGSPGATATVLHNQPCSAPTATAIEYRMRAWNQTGTSAAHFSPYTAPVAANVWAMGDINAHPEVELKVENIPGALRISWGPYGWTKVIVERRHENGSWAPLTEVTGIAQRTGFIDVTVPVNQRHFYRYRAAFDSWGVWTYSNWSNEKSGIRTGTRGGMIVSDTNPGLAVRAWDGAIHSGALKLDNTCTIANTDCTWTYRNGMLISDTDPTFAIRGGSTHLGEARLVNDCTPSNTDCTWTLTDGMFRSDSNPSLALNAYGGAVHGAPLKLVNNCTSSLTDCTFTYRDVALRSLGDENLMMNAYGGATHGGPLKLVNNCTPGHPDCTWTISRGRISNKGVPSLVVTVGNTGTPVKPLSLANDCPVGSSLCRFTLWRGLVMNDLPSTWMKAVGGATHLSDLKAVNDCALVLGGAPTPDSCKFPVTP
ncbi:MAG: hypothetical protein ACO1OB_33295 [Archangium sp.]